MGLIANIMKYPFNPSWKDLHSPTCIVNYHTQKYLQQSACRVSHCMAHLLKYTPRTDTPTQSCYSSKLAQPSQFLSGFVNSAVKWHISQSRTLLPPLYLSLSHYHSCFQHFFIRRREREGQPCRKCTSTALIFTNRCKVICCRTNVYCSSTRPLHSHPPLTTPHPPIYTTPFSLSLYLTPTPLRRFGKNNSGRLNESKLGQVSALCFWLSPHCPRSLILVERGKEREWLSSFALPSLHKAGKTAMH